MTLQNEENIHYQITYYSFKQRREITVIEDKGYDAALKRAREIDSDKMNVQVTLSKVEQLDFELEGE